MPTDPKAFAYFAAGIGAGLTIMGGAAGIGRPAAAAMEGIARQPNAAGDIRGLDPVRRADRGGYPLRPDRELSSSPSRRL
jgi:hypothetical protein